MLHEFAKYMGVPARIVLILIFLLLIAILLFVLLILLYTRLRALQKRVNVFFRMSEEENMEKLIHHILSEYERLNQRETDHNRLISELKERVRSSSQKTGIVRYNAKLGGKGNLSFALCVLDADNTGYLLNCMHTQEGCYNYLKEVEDGKVSVPMSEEEKEALDYAIHHEPEVQGEHQQSEGGLK